MHRFLLILSLLLFLGLEALFAQTKVITGKVIGDDGEPIPGASVVIKGTTTGVITDLDGAYNLQVPADATAIQISFLGMKTQELAIGDKTNLNATLENDAVNIDEVVVTALGMKRDKKALGYATQEVKADELTKASNPDVIKSMQGKLAGVDIKPSSGMPGASTQIIIRGARSFTGNNQPLYVIDGMPIASTPDFESGDGDGVTGSDFAGRALDIDPNDIESINILKGQAAAALYGIRASNGVVVITTKSGKNQQIGKTIVSINHSSSIEDLSRKPEVQTTWAQGIEGSYVPSTSLSWGPRIVDLPNDPDYGGNTDGLHPGKYYVPQREQAGLDPWTTPDVYDNIGDFYQLGHTHSTSANISQNNKNGNYSFGLGSTNQVGIVPSTGLNRYNAKLLVEVHLNEYWKTGASANFSTSNLDKAPSANDAIIATVHNAPSSYDQKGIPFHEPGYPYNQINYRSLTFNNPYWAAENNKFNEKNDRFFGNGFLELTPKLNWSEDKKLSFRYQAGIDAYTTHYQDVFEYGTRSSQVKNKGITHRSFNSLLTANYAMKFADDYEFTAMLGNEIVDSKDKTYEQLGQGLNFGGWPNIENATTVTGKEAQYQDRTVGFFGSVSLNYKSMLFLNATGREDIVSSMPNGNRDFFYPSISAGFVFTELDVFKNDILSFGKLRASYAQVGQAGDYTANYYSKPSYGGGFWANEPIIYPLAGVNAYTPNNIIFDPNLKPQNTVSYEVGTDLKFLNNRISFEYTYSRQNVKDQIFSVPLAGSSGASQRVMNGGKIHTDAHEIVLNILAISTQNWEWNVGVNYSRINNFVDELAPGVNSIFLGGFEEPQVRAQIGENFPVLYGTQFKKDAQGRILVDEDPTSDTYGMPMAGEMGVIGNCSPDFIMGGNTSLRWKDITLSATLSWQKGGQMINASNQMLNYYGMGKDTEDRTTPFTYPGYKADGTPNDIQRGGESDSDAYFQLYANSLGSISEAAVYDMDFVKLRELTLAYSVPKFYGVDITITGFARNLLLWAKMPNFDPEASQGNNNMGGYFERFSLPQTTSYGMSFNITF